MAAALLLAMPSAGWGSTVPGRCCFQVAIDVYYELELQYHGTADGAFKGDAAVSGGWSTRFIAAYTGRGLDLGGALGDALVSYDEAWAANYDVLSNPPGTPETVSGHVSCRHVRGSTPVDTGALPAEHWTHSSSPFDRVAASGVLAHAVKNVNGYARGLQVGNPAAGSPMTCPLEEGPAYFGLSFWGPLTLKAPSVNNFLAGQHFERVCSRGASVPGQPGFYTSGPLDHPFQQFFEGYLVAAARFTYFPQSDLKRNQRALDKLDGTKPAVSNPAYDAALDVIQTSASPSCS